MLKIHHLGLSRSDRIIWLAEELGLPYELVRHQRDPQTFRSPPSLKAVSPMGKAPCIEDGAVTLAESGAIAEYLLERYGNGRLRPRSDAPEYPAYLHWLHAAEATLMLPFLLDMLGTMMQAGSPLLQVFIDGEYATVLGYLERTVAAHDYVAGGDFTAADIMVSYDLQLANGSAIPMMKSSAPFERYPAIRAYLARLEARPAFRKTVELCRSGS